jgi:polyribonucleotide nucleotidyltransferase
MFENVIKKEIKWGDKTLSLETGKIARQASSVVAKMGDATIICSVTIARKETAGIDFVPLTVNYIEKYYSSGNMPSGFFKRETKPSEVSTLISRLIDRPIRPLFPSNYKYETCVFCTILSHDLEVAPEIVAMIGASAALAISPAPFEGPIAGVKVGYRDGKYLLNPINSFADNGQLELTVAGTEDSVLMVESEVKELSEDAMLEAVMFGQKEISRIVKFIKDFASECPVEKMQLIEENSTELEKKMQEFAGERLISAYRIIDKLERNNLVQDLKDEVIEKFAEGSEDEVVLNKIACIFENLQKEFVEDMILKTGKRIDGRGVTDIREIKAEVDILPVVHGSALFTRGQTQALVVATLGSDKDKQLVDGIDGIATYEKFMLQYNFPPYSVGEIGYLKAPGRRELGHGKLAYRAVVNMIDDLENYPFSIRIVSEIMESNGSSSMATVCGTSLALMATGVPMKKPVSGIAMGLIKKDKNYKILSDIMGDEDHLGSMDFKVAGTEDGITALQMDIKCKGITKEIMQAALKQAKEGRIHILGKMSEAITESRKEISKTAPKVETIKISTDKIKDVIGSRGKVIKEIIEKSGANIDVSDDGTIKLMANNATQVEKAVKMIRDITEEPEVGSVYEGKVVKIVDAGAFVNIMGNVDGFVHISELADYRVEFVDDVLTEGKMIKVKVIGYDKKGKIRLSYKAVNQKTGEAVNKKQRAG